jgi:hypothetical protein
MKTSTIDEVVLFVITVEAMYGTGVTVDFIKKNSSLDTNTIRESLKRLEKKKKVWDVEGLWELRPEDE